MRVLAQHDAFRSARQGRGKRRARWLVSAGCFLIALSVPGPAEETETARVLMLFSHNRLLPANIKMDDGFRRELNSRGGKNIDLSTEFLDTPRFSEEAQGASMAELFRERYEDAAPQVLVVVGEQASRLFLERRATLFPNTPLVFVMLSNDSFEQAKADANAAGIPVKYSVSATVDAMRRMRPGLREIVFVAGAAGLDLTWGRVVEAERRRLSGEVRIDFWSQLPLAEMLDRASSLPPEAAVLFLSYLGEPGGQATLVSTLVCRQLAAAASVPVFGAFETYVGEGAVGGHTMDIVEYGAAAARLVHRILDGESPSWIGIVEPPEPRFLFDARQVDRWKIPRRLLPQASVVLFDRKSLWQEHPRTMTGIITAIIAQAILILWLLIHRRQRRRAEAELRLSEERYREVVECQTELVCRYRPDTALTFVNEAYCRFFGQRRDELLGRSFLELIPPEKRAVVRQTLRRVMDGHGPVLHEHEVLRADGSVGWMEWQDFAIVDESGCLEEMQGIGRDITDQRRTAEALRESERNLAQATRLALVGEFAASIAHEINQPLGAILSNAEAAELLLETGSLKEVRQILSDIRKDDLRASQVIQHVRSLVGRRQAELKPVHLRELISGVVHLMTGEAARREVTVVTELAPELAPISADPVQIEQMLLNLMLNGMDAMADTPVERRRLTVQAVQEEPGFVAIRVTDNGHGIPSDALPRLFDSFFTTKENGMGLGLALARSIIEAHRGKISVENHPAGGAIFCLHLPVGIEHPPQHFLDEHARFQQPDGACRGR